MLMLSLVGKTAVDTGMASSIRDGAPSTSVVWIDAAGGSFWMEADGKGTSGSDKICSLDVGWPLANFGWAELSFWREADGKGTSGSDKICTPDVCWPSANIGWTELSADEGSPSWYASGAWFSVASSCGGDGGAAMRATFGMPAKGSKCWVVSVSIALASKSMGAGGLPGGEPPDGRLGSSSDSGSSW